MDLLKAAAQVATPTGTESLPDDAIGFALLYASPPDVETERARIAEALEGDRFDLFAYGPEDPYQLILNFPGVPIEQSPGYMLEQAEALRQALALVAVLPEVPALYTPTEYAPDDAAASTEALGGLLRGTCWSDATEPNDPMWSVRMVRADAAWARHGVSGKGVLIGQPDTGVALHRELAQGLRRDIGYNYVDGLADPTDPLRRSMGSPGHGTRTSSIVISRAGHIVCGTAPGAHVVPLRATNSVVLKGGRAVAKCVDHARLNGCHVVTMSLGAGYPLFSLARAVDRAVSADLIVLAAAGNCVIRVTYPASDDKVIAVAGVNVHGTRWRGSCRGRAVDISAPGENLHSATRTPGDGSDTAAQAAVERRSQGTSYAVATTAGVAALWLEHFGRAKIIAEARRRGTVVQELFRSALRATAQRPPNWDSLNMGAGIVDADALLSLPLGDIPGLTATESTPIIADLGIDDIPLHLQTEAGLVAMDWHLRSTPGTVALLETPLAPRLSPALASLLAGAGPAPLPIPALIAEPATPPEPLEVAFRRLATSDGTGRESAETLTPESALGRIRETGRDTVLDQAAAALSRRADAAPDLVSREAQTEALQRMAPVLGDLIAGGGAVGAPGETRAVLEALVRLTGRPAIRFQGGYRELGDARLGSWRDDLMPIRHRWYPYVEAVGRIDVELRPGEWAHAGTGLRLAGNRVITNRHVIDVFAEPLPTAGPMPQFRMMRPVAICFDPAPGPGSRRHALGRIVTAGARRIGRYADLRKLDLAILELDQDQDLQQVPAAPDRGIAAMQDIHLQALLVTGYPAAPVRPATGDAGAPDPFWDRIGEIYGDAYGVKYISPGYVMQRPGSVQDDPEGWSFSHDATTLAGNSGSAVVALHGDVQLAGIHFGGAQGTRNLAHDLARVKAGGDGAFDTALLP